MFIVSKDASGKISGAFYFDKEHDYIWIQETPYIPDSGANYWRIKLNDVRMGIYGESVCRQIILDIINAELSGQQIFNLPNEYTE